MNPSQILHIHGCIYINEDFILGHGKTLEELKCIKEKGKCDLSEEEFHKLLAEEAALSSVASQQKTVENLIRMYGFKMQNVVIPAYFFNWRQNNFLRLKLM